MTGVEDRADIAQKFKDAWSKARRVQVHFALAWPVYPLLITFPIMTILTNSKVSTLVTDYIFYVLGFTGCVLFAITSLRWQGMRCPNCGERMFMKVFFFNPFATKCLHCRTRIGYIPDEDGN